MVASFSKCLQAAEDWGWEDQHSKSSNLWPPACTSGRFLGRRQEAGRARGMPAPERHRKSPASVVPLYHRRWQMTSVALANNYTKNSLWWLYASTWLGHGTQMVGQALFWMLLWGCFWMRVTFLLVGWVKQIVLQNVGVPHPISWRSE